MEDSVTVRDAVWWLPLEDGRVACELCPVGCRLAEGQMGACGTRGNFGGRMAPTNYGKVVALGTDPIEKKPLYHYLPGEPILSIAAQGCNLHCAFCQNWSISQRTDAPTRTMEPADVVELARAEGSRGIAYTYSEPLVWYEFLRECARLAQEAGLRNVVVSNGFLNAEPLAELLPYLDAANIDLKSMDEQFYKQVCKGRLQPVLDNIRALHRTGVHVEVTNLVIPGHNDDDAQVRRLAGFLGGVSRDIPLHLSAYHPSWQFDAPATPPETLERARSVARDHLDFVYLGNVSRPGTSDTRCPDCDELLVERRGYRIRNRLGDRAACPACGRAIPIVLDGAAARRQS